MAMHYVADGGGVLGSIWVSSGDKLDVEMGGWGGGRKGGGSIRGSCNGVPSNSSHPPRSPISTTR